MQSVLLTRKPHDIVLKLMAANGDVGLDVLNTSPENTQQTVSPSPSGI